MFFLIAFGWLVAASFAFVLAILTPNWITIQTLVSTKNVTVHRGVFYVCDLVSTDSPFETKRCTSILEQTKSFEPFKWRYGTYRPTASRCLDPGPLLEYAISTASIAIGCAALSIIAVWLTGIYFNVRQRNRCTSCGLVMLSFFVLFICESTNSIRSVKFETLSSLYIDRCLDSTHRRNARSRLHCGHVNNQLATVARRRSIRWLLDVVADDAHFLVRRRAPATSTR